MKANIRSISGAVLMLVIIPIIAGLLACMPVPIGDPERSRIDPQMSGWWAMENDDGYARVALFRPYDKRTWLVMTVSVEKGDLADIEDIAVETAGDLVVVLQSNKVGKDGVVGESLEVYKAWLSRLGGHRFMTWEPVGQIEDRKKFLPDAWFVFRVKTETEDDFALAMIDGEYAGFDGLIEQEQENKDEGDIDVWKARKRWERVIRKNAEDPALYEAPAYRFRRLPDELESNAARIVEWPFDY